MDNPRPVPFDYAAFIDECRLLVQRAAAFTPIERSGYGVEFRRWRLELSDLLTQIRKSKYSPNIYVEGRSFHAGEDARDSEDNAVFNVDLHDTLTELQLLIARFDKYGDPKRQELDSRLEVAQRNHDAVVLQLQETQSKLAEADNELRESNTTLASMNDALAAATIKEEAIVAAFEEREANLLHQRELAAKPLAAPDKLTIRWLIDHMPHTGWMAIGGALVATFVAGVSFGNWPSVQAIVAQWAK
jgi:hypothetical protein